MARPSDDDEQGLVRIADRRFAGLLWLTVALAGCAHAPPGSPAFQDGYVAGCADGYFDADGPTGQVAWVRNDARFGSDSDYQAGWQEAYVACFQEQTDHPTMGVIGR